MINSINYFELFSLPQQFALDLNSLDAVYKTLMMQCHPDKVAAKTDFEKKQAVMMAAMINDAYNTLKHPLDRASYLLKLKGIDVDKNEPTRFPPEFLMEQMQWRERLEEGIQAQDKEDLNNLQQEVILSYQQLLSDLSQSLDSNDDDQSILLIGKGRFLNKITEHIEQVLTIQ